MDLLKANLPFCDWSKLYGTIGKLKSDLLGGESISIGWNQISGDVIFLRELTTGNFYIEVWNNNTIDEVKRSICDYYILNGDL